jgi:hypothetical protein
MRVERALACRQERPAPYGARGKPRSRRPAGPPARSVRFAHRNTAFAAALFFPSSIAATVTPCPARKDEAMSRTPWISLTVAALATASAWLLTLVPAP